MFTLTLFASQGLTAQDQTPLNTSPSATFVSAQADTAQAFDINLLIDEVVNVLQNRPELNFDPANTESVFAWWIFIFAVIMPLITKYILQRWWPALEKDSLVIRASSMALVVILIIVFSQGASLAVIGQGVLAFVMKVLMYDKIYKPLGLGTVKPEGYKK